MSKNNISVNELFLTHQNKSIEIIKVAEIYEVTNIIDNAKIGSSLKIIGFSNMLKTYFNVNIIYLGKQSISSKRSSENEIFIFDKNKYYKLDITLSETLDGYEHIGDWHTPPPIEEITNISGMNYLKYKLPISVYYTLIGAITGSI